MHHTKSVGPARAMLAQLVRPDLPAAPPGAGTFEASMMVAGANGHTHLVGGSERATLRVLILDDSAREAELLVDALHRDGLAFTWQRVDTREDYLSQIDPPPDIVLADHGLADFDASRALALLQDLGLDVPCILVTGTMGDDEAVACLKLGAVDYLLKDRLHRLGGAVRRALTEQRLRGEKRQAQTALRESEARYRAVSELTSDFAYSFTRTATGDQVCEWLTGAAARIFGVTANEINVRGGWAAFLYPDDLPLAIEHNAKVWAGQAAEVELRALTPRGELLWLRLHDRPICDPATGQVVRVIGAGQDITLYRQAEAALRASEARHRHLIEHLPVVVYTSEAAPPYNTTYVSPQIEALLGFPPEAWIADPTLWISRLHPEDRGRMLAFAERLHLTGGPASEEFRSISRDGRVVWQRDEAVIVPAEDGKPAFCQGVLLDITARKEAEARVSRQVDRLTALRLIDMAITASLDRKVTLNVILNQLSSRLGVNAAAVLVHNPHLHVLEHAASRGFRGQAVITLRLRLGESHAGRAALERRRVIVPDLSVDPPQPPGLVAAEGLVHYIAQPLIGKGEVKGVLVLFQRHTFTPDDEWLDFLEALAEQAAIALDNASLFESLQHANLELALAYDATIEGWSHALDLRDKETEGHSQRVTAMTVRLAQALGLSSEDLVHIRRGALLHDIGKMGIPDGILLKPGPLTEEEWAVMRLHPTFAYELLQPIRHLHRALDIPYCHHEKWDGTGYPRGLQGEQIPLAARIFAVVDVWDALSSNRPYRRAWPSDKILRYLQEQAGSHFDPAVVEAFLLCRR